LIPNPIRNVLSSMRMNGVSYLLMGGQACVLYGGAEFSRDTDITVLAEPANLEHLSAALAELQADCIAIPPFERKYLDMGLAVHFRCRHPLAPKQRVDVMTKMRGVDPFSALWLRRSTFDLEGEPVEVLALPDLVKAKKTQRDKDWPMLSRLIEANYTENRDQPTSQQIEFWIIEMRTPALLMEIVKRFPDECRRYVQRRELLSTAVAQDEMALTAALKVEEEFERAADRAYWLPLRQELQKLRAASRKEKWVT
jgi:hypothetical protein